MGILANENAISSGGYQISNSLRFQSASSQYLARTWGSGSGTTATFSFWIKRGILSATENIFHYDNGSTRSFDIIFNTSDQLNFVDYISGGNLNLLTTQVFRDPSAWYHIVAVIDTTQATAANRAKLYVNGSQITTLTTATYPSQNYVTNLNQSGGTFKIGSGSSTAYYDGYMAEFNFIDGQALTPSSFGETNTLTGQWVAKKYTGTYGTNGFYLPFSNGTSTTTLGADSSGNGNNWTLTNFTRSAGVSDCWMYDVPSGNGGASGTQPSSNYAVLNPLDVTSTSGFSFSAANLKFTTSSANAKAVSSMLLTSGKWYCELTATTAANLSFGISQLPVTTGTLGYNVGGLGFYQQTGAIQMDNVTQVSGLTLANNDVLAAAIDADARTFVLYKNGVAQNTAITYPYTTGVVVVAGTGVSGAAGSINFGQRSFAYTPPSGFKALCTANLPVATIVKGNKYMDATTYTGNGGTQTVTNAAGFKPDLVWLKNRSGAYNHALNDSVRGAGQTLESNTTNSEFAYSAYFTAINSNGFSLAGGIGQFNLNTNNYVAWQWQAGQGTTSSNTNGSITSTVSVNATAGFSVVTYTGTGANATVGHGLGVAPELVIVKSRSAAATNWNVLHVNAVGATRALFLNSNVTFTTSATYWNNTNPTSSVFSIGTDAGCNTNGATYVAYCFSSIKGFSAFPYFIGNGSVDGTFLYLGFRPKFVMIKNTGIGDWVELDTSRDQYNVASANLLANSSAAETSSSSIDILSNGIKIRTTSANYNTNGNYYAVIAFAENPFQNSNAR